MSAGPETAPRRTALGSALLREAVNVALETDHPPAFTPHPPHIHL
jgi:hypothetical protein